MTEKIIIDGVNVAGCQDFLEPNGCDNNDCISFQCDRNYNCQHKQLKRLEQELKWTNDEEKYLKDCCIKAGKELEKHSFKWDGKEKNLVVQALQLNQLYEKLEQENKTNEKQIELDVEHMCRLNEQIDELEQENKQMKSALEEIREDIKCFYSFEDSSNDYKLVEIIDKINEVIG